MVLKVILQKESPKQSQPKVSSEAAVRRCSSKQVFSEISVLRPAALFKRNFNTGVFW